MKYIVYNHCKWNKAEELEAALSGKLLGRTVYVVGVEDHVALASILASGEMTEVAQSADISTLAPLVKFIEAIGVPDGVATEKQLIELAKQRIKELEAK